MNSLGGFFSVKNMVPGEVESALPSNREAYMNYINVALPSVLESVLVTLIGTIDTAMVGGLGAEAIAAVGLVGQPRMLMLCVFMALNVGITAVVARRKGEERRDSANATMRTGLLVCGLLSLLMTIVAQIVAEPLMYFAGAQAETIRDATDYFRIIMWVLPLNVLSMAICAAQRGVGNTRLTMVVNVASNLLNVLFNYLLINGVGPFPRLEVRGAAIATAMGFAFGFILSVISLVTPRARMSFLHLSLRDRWIPDRESLGAIGKVGGNAIIEQLAMRFGFFSYAKIVAGLGTMVFASHQVCIQFLNISFGFADGLAVGATSLVGQMLGRKEPKVAHMYGKMAQRFAMVVGLLLGALVIVFRTPLVGLFTADPEVIRLSSVVMICVGIFQPFQTQAIVNSGALRGAGDTRYVAKVMLITTSVVRPAAALLAVQIISGVFHLPEWALVGAWLASLLDIFIRLILTNRRFNGGKWHAIKV